MAKDDGLMLFDDLATGRSQRLPVRRRRHLRHRQLDSLGPARLARIVSRNSSRWILRLELAELLS